MQGKHYQRQGDHQAGKGMQQVGQALGPERQAAFVAHHQEAHRQRQQHAETGAAQ
ncbi:hypothetical protein D3C72_2125390 [compost metagenome]